MKFLVIEYIQQKSIWNLLAKNVSLKNIRTTWVTHY